MKNDVCRLECLKLKRVGVKDSRGCHHYEAEFDLRLVRSDNLRILCLATQTCNCHRAGHLVGAFSKDVPRNGQSMKHRDSCCQRDQELHDLCQEGSGGVVARGSFCDKNRSEIHGRDVGK